MGPTQLCENQCHINQGRIQDFPLGGAPTQFGVPTSDGHLSAKIHSKTNELGPIGGGRGPLGRRLGSANVDLVMETIDWQQAYGKTTR